MICSDYISSFIAVGSFAANLAALEKGPAFCHAAFGVVKSEQAV